MANTVYPGMPGHEIVAPVRFVVSAATRHRVAYHGPLSGLNYD